MARRLDEILARYPAPRFQPLAWILVALLAAAGAWAAQARLDTVATAQGKVVPQGELKVVQHLEGGVIEDIHVREGDEVDKGQPLIQLDLSTSATNTDELAVELDGLRLERARLDAEAEGEPLDLPDDLVAARPELAAAERRTHRNRMAELESEVRVLKDQKRQRELEIEELKAREQAVKADLALARERYEQAEPLVEQQLVTEVELNEAERDMQKLKGELQTIRAGLPRAQAALAEVRSKLDNVRQRFRTKASNELSKVERKIQRRREQLDRAQSEARRMQIDSPIDGIIKTLIYNTVGGVVRPGEPIMEIVPVRDELVVEARLDPVDVGHVEAGMPATVKFTTYDFVRYGGLEGEVVSVGADVEEDEEGNQYFPIEVRTDKAYLESGGRIYDIFPGMQTQVDIHLGDKTVMDFLLQPVLKMRYEAFRER